MSRFSGPQQEHAVRVWRKRKRAEAAERNAATPAERRRWHRQVAGLPTDVAAQVAAAKGSDGKVARLFGLSPLAVAAIRNTAKQEEGE